MFIVNCQKNQAKVTQTEPITSGSSNVYVVQFRLSEEWDQLTATAVFRAGYNIVNVLLDEDRECMVPWEVMQNPGEQVTVGVFGTMNGNVVLPTIWANMGNLQQGVTTGIYMSEPTPSVYQQIVDDLRRIRNRIDEGVPYAIDGLVNVTITNLNDLRQLTLPANVILLNATFQTLNKPPVEEQPDQPGEEEWQPEEIDEMDDMEPDEEEPNIDNYFLHYQNEIVYLEILEDNRIRLTDYEGNVYDFITDEVGDIIGRIFVRDGTIKTAYDLAVENGFVGTVVEWLNSLRGPLPIYYTGKPLSPDSSLETVMVTELTIPANDISRFCELGEFLMIPVEPNDGESYLVTYRVDGITIDSITCNPVNVIRTTGKTGPKGEQGNQGETGERGPQGIQGEQGVQGPIGHTTLWVETESSLEEIKKYDVLTISDDDFSREAVDGEDVSGTIISAESVYPPYLYFVTGKVLSTAEGFTTIRINLASNLHVTIDGFTPDFITEQDVKTIRDGGEVINKPNAVVGLEALKAILKSGMDAMVVETSINTTDWKSSASGLQWDWVFPEGVYPRLVIVNDVDSWAYFKSYGSYEDKISFYSDTVPTRAYKMLVIFGTVSSGAPTVVINHDSAIVPVEKGGTGETTLAAAYSSLLNASTTAVPVNKGGTGVTTLAGTDYTTYRARAIAVGTTVPTGVENGYLYGIYE